MIPSPVRSEGQRCVVCGNSGTVQAKAQNALPAGIVICDGCREAIKSKQVGIVLHVTDSRAPEAGAQERHP